MLNRFQRNISSCKYFLETNIKVDQKSQYDAQTKFILWNVLRERIDVCIRSICVPLSAYACVRVCMLRWLGLLCICCMYVCVFCLVCVFVSMSVHFYVCMWIFLLPFNVYVCIDTAICSAEWKFFYQEIFWVITALNVLLIKLKKCNESSTYLLLPCTILCKICKARFSSLVL